ncbi:gustatory receptor 112 [Tribolium castaneum]|uniref:Gustatory receptor n=1 Tax=Tribolium castaneum TaxID=7070 RepID=D6WRP9_TRICA|nr:gustatory receptor 112 [Tribolium castaneum]
MTSNLSKDLIIIRPLWKFFNIFQITPYYDFNKNTATHSNLRKLHGVIFILIKLAWIFVMLNNKGAAEMLTRSVMTEKFTYILGIISGTVITLTTLIKSSFFNFNTWRMLFTNFYSIDAKLQNGGKIEINIWKNYFHFILKQVVLLAFLLYQVYSWSIFLKISVLQSLWNSPLCDFFYEFQIFTLLTSILSRIKTRYKLLNARFARIKTNPKVVQELQQCVQIYRILGETVEIYNNLFGHQILLITFHCGLQLVACFNFSLIAFNTTNFNVHIVLCNIAILTLMLFCFIWMVISMETTVQEAEAFVHFCFKLQENFIQDSREINTLRKLTTYAQHFTRNFSAAGYFSIRKSVIFGLLGNAATYLIIAIQFNER